LQLAAAHLLGKKPISDRLWMAHFGTTANVVLIWWLFIAHFSKGLPYKPHTCTPLVDTVLPNSELTKAEIADKFWKEFEESGRKINNIKQKITKVAQRRDRSEGTHLCRTTEFTWEQQDEPIQHPYRCTNLS